MWKTRCLSDSSKLRGSNCNRTRLFCGIKSAQRSEDTAEGTMVYLFHNDDSFLFGQPFLYRVNRFGTEHNRNSWIILLQAKKVCSTFCKKEVGPVKEIHTDKVENKICTVFVEYCNSKTRRRKTKAIHISWFSLIAMLLKGIWLEVIIIKETFDQRLQKISQKIVYLKNAVIYTKFIMLCF